MKGGMCVFSYEFWIVGFVVVLVIVVVCVDHWFVFRTIGIRTTYGMVERRCCCFLSVQDVLRCVSCAVVCRCAYFVWCMHRVMPYCALRS